MTTERFNFASVLREVDRRNESALVKSSKNSGQYVGLSRRMYAKKSWNSPTTKNNF